MAANSNLITNVMYYSLFHTQLFNNENDITKYFPKNAFGIVLHAYICIYMY